MYCRILYFTHPNTEGVMGVSQDIRPKYNQHYFILINYMLQQNKNSNIKTPMTVCIWNNIIFVSENNNAESAPKSNIIRHCEALPVPMVIGKAISFY